MVRWPTLLLVLAASGMAQDLAPETLLLQKARTLMHRNLQRLPNYTCTQTIERLERRGGGKKPEPVDLLRLEVALVNGKELFAWPGSRTFLETEISDLVPSGAIGTGSFALHAKNLFQTDVPRFTYLGEEALNGRRANKWDFEISSITSGYRIRMGSEEAIVAYHGSFWADAANSEILRIHVVADVIPERLRIRKATDTIDYARMRIGSQDFLLPSLAELSMISVDGRESINRTAFANCRQYTGESRLILEDEDTSGTAPAGGERIVEVPVGRVLALRLDTPVAPGKTAVGDMLRWTTTGKTDLGNGVVIPKNATVRGRLTLLRRRSSQGYVAGMKLSEAVWPGHRAVLAGSIDSVLTVQPRTAVSATAPFPGFATGLENATIFGSIIFLNGIDVRLPAGTRMYWRTEAPEPEDRP